MEHMLLAHSDTRRVAQPLLADRTRALFPLWHLTFQLFCHVGRTAGRAHAGQTLSLALDAIAVVAARVQLVAELDLICCLEVFDFV